MAVLTSDQTSKHSDHDIPFGPRDDIPDPPLPPSVAGTAMAGAPPILSTLNCALSSHDDAVLHAFTQRLSAWMSDQHVYSGKFMDATVNACKRWMDTMIGQERQRDTVLADVVRAGLSITGAPYQAQVTATSPQGYGVTIRVEKADAASLVEELGRMTTWLKAQGYDPEHSVG